ncbi:MAG: tetratricopeptide repeat protein, partial [bacterium]
MKIVKIKTTTVPRAFEIITDEEKLLIGFSTSDDGLRYKSILTIVKWMAQGKGKISAKELKMMIPLEGESYPKFYRQWRDYANSRRYGKNYPFTLSRSAGNNWKLIEDKKVKHDFATAFFHNQDKDFESALFWLGDYKITKVEFNPLLEDQAEKNEGTSQTASIKKPLQRPRPADYFLGREAQINKILPRLQPGSIITICAPGGIGKTALAAEILKRMISDNKPPERFEDGVVFYSFYGQPDTNKALEAIARAFGYEPKPNPADAAFNALSGKRVLLVLDGTEEADDLRKVLRVAGNCGILITSRNSRDAVVDREDLAPLEPDEALKLLYDWAEGKIDNENSAKSTCEIVGGLPLAVRLIGHYLRQTKDETVSSYLEWLEKTPLDALDPDEKRHRENSVPWLLQRSLKQVGEQAISVIALCGCLALAPFSRNLISEVLGFSLREVRLAFKQLTGYGFLLSINADRYEVSHALIHTYAHERLQVGSNVIERLIDKYIYLAEAETKKGLIGYHHLDTERLHIVYLLKVCIKRGAWDAAMRLAWAIEDYMDIQGYWIERLTVNETGWKSALQLKNRIKEGAWLNRLGLTYNDLGQMEKAIEYYQLALSINREIGDRRDEGIVLGNMGLAHRAIGQMEKAIEYHQQALSIDREIGDRKSEGIDLGNLGIVYRELGQIEKAIEYHQQALSIDREIGDR